MVASLLVSVLLLGFKLSALRRLVQVNQRRTELKVALLWLQSKLEDEHLATWMDDVGHDAERRHARIGELALASGNVYSTMEKELIEKGRALFALFESSSAGVTQLKHSELVLCSETKLDEATRLLLGQAAAMVRATPQEIVAYLLNYDSRHLKSLTDKSVVLVRSEALEHVNAHHTIIFNRGKLGHGLSERTFLNSIVAKRVADDPPTYIVVVVPIVRHAKITRKDEARAVRAENCRSFKLTEVTGVTKMEYACSIDLRGLIPQAITNKTAVPGQQRGAPSSSSLSLAHLATNSRLDEICAC